MILLAHPTGNTNVRHAAVALRESRQLAAFWTCIAMAPDAAILRWLPRRWRSLLGRRAYPPLLKGKVRTFPFPEAMRMVASRAGWETLVRHEKGAFCVDAVYRALDRRVSRVVAASRLGTIKGVYAYEDGALETFRASQARGIRRIYDLPIGYWRVWKKLRDEERERQPEWAATLQGAGDSDEKLARKDEELRLAECVLVASRFTSETLAASGIDAGIVHAVGYGGPPVRRVEPDARAEGPLRVLFVGALSQRKGLSYLIEAIALSKTGASLTLIGRRPAAECIALETALREHRWIPSLPHDEILREMQRHDVLVFPSLFEGFGLVILEAMSQGLPVITTPHTAGPDIIAEGVDGFIVPIRDAGAIATHLETLASDPARLRAMKHAALAKARTRRWSDYEEKLAAVVKALISQRSESEAAA